MKKINIEKWKFKNKEVNDAWKKDYNDNDWEIITVPHDWSVSKPFSLDYSSGTGYLAGGIGWYRTVISKEDLKDIRNKVIKLHFEGVYKGARVWVNGYHLGERPSGYASFYFDLTELANYSNDGDLVISVRAERQNLADSRWYNGMGINRPVTLEIHENIYLEDYGTVFTTTEVNEQEAILNISHNITNNYEESHQILVNNKLIDKEDNAVLSIDKEVEIKAKSSSIIEFKNKLLNPKLWSPETPNLYKLETTIFLKDEKNDRYSSKYLTTVGIREIEFDSDNGFYINGKPTKLKGVCLHEDAGTLGTAVPSVVWARRLEKLKDMGTNAIRMAHNPHSTVMYDLCDALGFFVIDEAFDEWENPKNKWWQGHNVYPPKLGGYAKDFIQWYERDLENMVMKNRNHPSIIAWSIGNEVDYPNDPYANPLFEVMTGNNDYKKPEEERIYNPNRPDMARLTTIANTLSSIVKRIDSTRPVTLAAAFPELSSELGFLDNIDLIGYNYKEHLYESHHKKFIDTPMLGSENNHGYQEWLAVETNDYISGQFLWTGIDYLGEAAGWPVHGSPAGLLTVAGFEKEIFYLRKSWWSKEPVNRIVTIPVDEKLIEQFGENGSRKWNYPLNNKIKVQCYSNASQVKLYLGDKYVEDMPYRNDIGYFESEISYESEELRTEAIFEKETVIDSLVPKYGASQIQVKSYELEEDTVKKIRSHIKERDSRIAQLEVQIIDIENQPTLDEVMIHLEVENGHLLGIENGDLSDPTSYTEEYRRTFKGKLICYIEKNSNIENCSVAFKAESLPTQIILLG